MQTQLPALPSLRNASLPCPLGCRLAVTKLPWDAGEKTVLSGRNPLERAGDGGCCYSPHVVASSSPAPAVQALEATDSYLTFSVGLGGCSTVLILEKLARWRREGRMLPVERLRWFFSSPLVGLHATHFFLTIVFHLQYKGSTVSHMNV